jgi:uncharacterized protein YaeQ
MALTSTIYTATVDLSDVDRGVYASLEVRLAMHPSESPAYLATRLLAWPLEYTEGIEFTPGLSNGDEPAIVVRDLTGRVTAWIEVGSPAPERLHRASKAADRVAVYTYRDPRILLGQLEGKKIHRAAEIPIYAFGRGFIDQVAASLGRRMAVTLSVTERHLYLDINGTAFETAIEEHRAA